MVLIFSIAKLPRKDRATIRQEPDFLFANA
jgi:hypothetical protein